MNNIKRKSEILMFIVINLKYFYKTFSNNSGQNIAKINVVPVPVLVEIKVHTSISQVNNKIAVRIL